MTRRFVVVAVFLVVLSASSAFADNVSGKITVVQTTSSGTSSSISTRFFFGAQKVSLLSVTAAPEHRALLIAAFASKANVDATYTKTTCPAGISGTCGTVNLVSVDASTIP